jgi:hypothetical protein
MIVRNQAVRHSRRLGIASSRITADGFDSHGPYTRGWTHRRHLHHLFPAAASANAVLRDGWPTSGKLDFSTARQRRKNGGTVYFTSTLGGIVATFWLGLYFIPVAGLRVSTTLTGLALAALPALYLLKMLFGAKKEDAQPTKRSKRLSEKSTVKGRAKRSIYLFAVLEGATVMAVELLAARMVARYFGSSLYVWGTVIGFTLLALAIGYFAGGVIADKYSGPDPLLWALLAASVFLLLMHVTAPLLTIAFANISPGAAVILVSMALILPPLLFMGMVPTFLVRRVSATAESAGANTGMVYTISSASGIVALPLFGFFCNSAIRIDAAVHLHWARRRVSTLRKTYRAEKLHVPLVGTFCFILLLGDQDGTARQDC